ncbi:MAG: hypothetical protein M3Q10_02505 [Chloroflexota bacterium]|nr:hypothetical protein [Chloroflexota bacterium]
MIRILVIDDHAAFRQSFAFLPGRRPRVQVIGRAGAVAEAPARSPEADLLVTDCRLPNWTRWG